MIELVLQFLLENGLSQSALVLQSETEVCTTSTISDVIASSINHGRWDEVLKSLQTVQLKAGTLVDLFELMFLDLLEKGETSTCHKLLTESSALAYLRTADPLSNVRYKRLEALLEIDTSASSVFGDRPRNERRKALIHDIRGASQVVPASRLLQLIRRGILWEKHIGIIPSDTSAVNLVTGQVKKAETGELRITGLKRSIKFPKGSFPESVIFSHDGQHIISGSSDGLIEIYSIETGKLALEFDYQARDEYMVHSSSVTALALDHTGRTLASGDKSGDIHIWELASGKIIKSFQDLHRDAITSIEFAIDDLQILTAGLDKLAQVAGIRNGRVMECYGLHDAFVISALFLGTDRVVTASCDGNIRVFLRSGGKLLVQFSPSTTLDKSLGIPPLKGLVKAPSGNIAGERFIVCPHGITGFEIDSDGGIAHSYAAESAKNDDLVSVQISPMGSWAYFASERGNLHVFDRHSGALVQTIKTGETVVTCLAHHPKRPLMAASSTDGHIYILGR